VVATAGCVTEIDGEAMVAVWVLCDWQPVRTSASDMEILARIRRTDFFLLIKE
jgi:hypothetical protein